MGSDEFAPIWLSDSESWIPESEGMRTVIQVVAGGKQHAQTSTTAVAIDTSHSVLQLCLNHINKQSLVIIMSPGIDVSHAHS